MSSPEPLKDLKESLSNIHDSSKSTYEYLRQARFANGNLPFDEVCQTYMENQENRLERMRSCYRHYSSRITAINQNFKNQMDLIEQEDKEEYDAMIDTINEANTTLKENVKDMDRELIPSDSKLTFYYRGNKESKLTLELVLKYPSSYPCSLLMNNQRTNDGNIFIDWDGQFDDQIIKYMKDDDSFMDDVSHMTFDEKRMLMNTLDQMNLPVKRHYMMSFFKREVETIDAWNNRKYIMVKNKNNSEFNQCLKKYDLFDAIFSGPLRYEIQYNKDLNIFYIDLQLTYFDIIEDYLINDKKISNPLLFMNYIENNNIQELAKEFELIGIHLSQKEYNEMESYFNAFILPESKILTGPYSRDLKKFIGTKDHWTLLYRGSDEGFSAQKFHEKCDNKGPTVTLVRTEKNNVFGGYASQSWTSDNGIFSFFL